MENMSMEEIFKQEESEGFERPKKNQRRVGEIVLIRDDSVVVNLHYKSDGVLPLSEISNPDNLPLNELFKVGDEVEVLVLKYDPKDGEILLSSKRLKSRKDWEELEQKFNENQTIKVKVQSAIKSGLVAYYNDIRCFIPASQVDVNFVPNLKNFVGQEIEVAFLEFDRRKNQVILSRKQLVEKEYNKKLEEFWNNIEEGQIITGIVRRFTPYGAFVEIGPVDGLVHVSEIQWGKLTKPSELLQTNKEMEFKVISVDRENNKVSLSRKQLIPNPWDVVNEKYEVDQRYDGKVISLTDFGAFVELEPGLEGLVHVSQISEDRIEKPSDVLELGEEVVVKIVEINPDEKRIKLTMKE